MPDTPFEYTPNLAIGKFHDDEFPGETELNSMRDKLDRLMVVSGAIATRPAHAITTPPRLFYSTDETPRTLYRDDPVNGWEAILQDAQEKISVVYGAAGNIPVFAPNGELSNSGMPLVSLVGALIWYGGWSAASGSLPAAPMARAYYAVTAAGTVSGESYVVGDIIVYNIGDPSLPSSWTHLPTGAIAFPADALSQDEVDRIQLNDGGTRTENRIPVFDATGDLKESAYGTTELAAMASDIVEVQGDLATAEADIIGLDSDKADKVVPAAAGNIAKLSVAGNLQDSGIPITDIGDLVADIVAAEADIDALEVDVAAAEATIETHSTDIASLQTAKADVIAAPVEDNLVAQDATGNIKDGGKKISTMVSDTDTEVPTAGAVVDYAPARAAAPAEDNLKSFDDAGNDKDSGVAIEAAVTDSAAKIPTSAAVVDYAVPIPATAAENDIATFNASKGVQASGKQIETSLTDTDAKIPTSQAVKEHVLAARPRAFIISLGVAAVAEATPNLLVVQIPYAMSLAKVRLSFNAAAPTGTGSTKGLIKYHATDPTALATIFSTGPETEAPAVTDGNFSDDSGTPDTVTLAAGSWIGVGFSSICGTTGGTGWQFTLLEA
jgi:hypothetical protein